MADPNDLSDVVSRAVSAIQQRPQTSRQAQSNDSDNISRIEPDVQLADQQVQDDHNWRNILSFWVLGLCNNYGFVVMLSAAYDIIKRFDSVSVRIMLGLRATQCVDILTNTNYIFFFKEWIFDRSTWASHRSGLQHFINRCSTIR